MSSGMGKKRGAHRSGSNSTSSMQQQPNQVRQGSSFCTCPACGTVVHCALVSFHLSSCPVVASAPVRTTPLPRLRSEEERREHGTEQGLGSPEFASASMRKGGGIPQKKSPWEAEEEEDVSDEEQLQRGVSSSPPFMETGDRGEKLYPIPKTPNPETPILEGRERTVGSPQTTVSPLPVERTERDRTPDARKRLFQEWGQKLSPEPELVVHLSPINAAVATPSSADPEEKRAKVVKPLLDEGSRMDDLGLIDSGSREGGVADVGILPYVGSIQDSQEERQQGVAAHEAYARSKEILQEIGNRVESQLQQLHCDDNCSLETGMEMMTGKRVDDGASRREIELANALHELREKHSDVLLREIELQRALQVKKEECEDLRKREQELQIDLLSVKGLLEKTLQEWRDVVNRVQQKTASETHELSQMPTQTYKEEESMATQLLSQTSNTPGSCSSSPRAVKDELPISRLTRVSSENLVRGHNLYETDIEEQATQLIAGNLSPACPPCVPDASQNSLASAEFRGVCCPGSERRCGADGDSFPSQYPARRLFDGGTDLGKKGSSKDESSTPSQSASIAPAVLAPHTSGNALKPVGGHEKGKEYEENGDANLHTAGNQRTEGTPGGLVTPENFAVMLGKQEKGLISEMLDNFPPAQGIEPQRGIDPFDDVFLETVNTNTSDLPSSVWKDPAKVVPVTERDIDQNSIHYSGRVGQNVDRILSQNECRPASPQPCEDSQQENLTRTRPQKKRRKTALVIDSESDGDVGSEHIAHDLRQPSLISTGDSRRGTENSTSSGGKIGEFNSGLDRQASSLAEVSRPDPIISIIEASSRDGSFDRRRPSSPTINELFGAGGEQNGPAISAGGSRKRTCRSNSGNSPDLIVEALSRDRSWDKVFSPRSGNVILSSDDEEDIHEDCRGSGKQGKRRRLVRVQESPDAALSLQRDLDFKGTKEAGTKAVRRSDRLRNVYVSTSQQNDVFSEQDAQGDSDRRRNEGLATSGHDGSGFKPHVLDDDDDDIIHINSDSSDGRPSPTFQRHRNDEASQRMRGSAVQQDLFGNQVDVDDDDDIDTDDSDFINDDPESDAVDEISESGEESEDDGSSSGRNSSGERKKYNWEYEADMLADLANDKDLCCRGVCAIYRRQEVDEKIWSSSKYVNNRGFSKFDSARASKYSSFLMEGAMSGPVVKTAKELEEQFDEDAVIYCSDKCIHYSKQLFDIYQKNEDPYFPEPYAGSNVEETRQ